MMETGNCNIPCVFLHLFINVLLLILGMSLLGLGLAEESTELSALLSNESKIGSIAVIIGVILIVLTTVDCCFTIDGTSVFYSIYAGLLVLLFTAMLGLLIGYGTKIEVTVRKDISASMSDMMRYDPDGSGKTEMDSIQQTFQCCGIDSYKDWYNVTEHPVIPRSCCIQIGCDTSVVENIQQKDCVTNIMETADSQFAKISAVGIAITIFLPIQAVIVLYLIRYGDNNDAI